MTPIPATPLPCPNPWCFSLKHSHLGKPSIENWRLAAPFDKFSVKCSACGVEGPVQPTEAEAIAAWNTRPAAQIQDADFVAGWRMGMEEIKKNGDGSEPWKSILERGRRELAELVTKAEHQAQDALAKTAILVADQIDHMAAQEEPTEGDVKHLTGLGKKLREVAAVPQVAQDARVEALTASHKRMKRTLENLKKQFSIDSEGGCYIVNTKERMGGGNAADVMMALHEAWLTEIALAKLGVSLEGK